MTELEILARDCIENHTHKLVRKPTKQDIYLREESIFIQGYRQSEKKIEELEQKLEQTEKDLADYQFNYPTIKELSKENAKLREKVNILDNCDRLSDVITEAYKEQLTKAKEIIMNLRNIITSDITIIDTEEKGLFFKQAVEFLKEEA